MLPDDYQINVSDHRSEREAAWNRRNVELQFYSNAFLKAPERVRWHVSLTQERAWFANRVEWCLHLLLDEIIAGLKEILRETEVIPLRRIVTAQFLYNLGFVVYAEVLFDLIETGDDATQAEVLRTLRFLRLWEAPEECHRLSRRLKNLLPQLTNQSIKKEALECVSSLMRTADNYSAVSKERAESEIELLVVGESSEIVSQLSGSLPRDMRTKALLDEQLSSVPQHRWRLIVSDFFCSGDPAAVSLAIEKFDAAFPWNDTRILEDGVADGSLTHQIYCLAEAGEAGLPLLWRIWNSGLGNLYREAALEGIAAVDFQSAMPHIKNALADKKSTLGAIRLLKSKLASGIDGREIVSILRPLVQSASRRHTLEICDLLKDVDLDLFCEIVAAVDCSIGDEPVAPITGRNMISLIERMAELGIGKPVSLMDVANAMKKDPYTKGISEMNRWAQYVLESSGVFCLLSLGPTQVSLAMLARDILASSGGVFAPDWYMDYPVRPELAEDGAFCEPELVRSFSEDEALQPALLFEFETNNRLYQLRTHVDEWVPLEAITSVFHRALLDSGRVERFNLLDLANGSVGIVFADPTAFRTLAHEFGWPADASASQVVETARKCYQQILGGDISF